MANVILPDFLLSTHPFQWCGTAVGFLGAMWGLGTSPLWLLVGVSVVLISAVIQAVLGTPLHLHVLLHAYKYQPKINS